MSTRRLQRYYPDVTRQSAAGARVLVVGEILWDVFADATRLGGAALNFAVQLERLGHDPRIVSAIGADMLGHEAGIAIASLGLDTTFLQTTARFSTGTASVRLGPGDHTSFVIERPAAYDAVELSDAILRAGRAVDADLVLLRHALSFLRARQTGAATAAGRAAATRAGSTTSTCGRASSRRTRQRPAAHRECRQAE